LVPGEIVMRFATLISWLLTASLGAFMLRTWLARGGLGRERARIGGLPPQLIFGHAGLALSGLLVWSGYVATGTKSVAWTAVGLLMVAIALGLCTVTLWTPYPARRPGERRAPAPTDESAVVVPYNPDNPDDLDDPASGGSPDPSDSLITDAMIAQLLAEPLGPARHPPIRPNPAVLVPIAHGFAAIGTFVLAVMAATT
jgi:hypothetical protein